MLERYDIFYVVMTLSLLFTIAIKVHLNIEMNIFEYLKYYSKVHIKFNARKNRVNM